MESTSLHLVQSGISRLLALFPDRDFDPLVIDEYNRIGNNEFERIRDFLVLHYRLTRRTDAPLWRHCQTMEVPDSLRTRIEHFRRYGRVVTDRDDLFGQASWVAVHVGQFNLPQRHDPLADHRATDGLGILRRIGAAMAEAAEAMPSHADFIQRHCAAAPA